MQVLSRVGGILPTDNILLRGNWVRDVWAEQKRCRTFQRYKIKSVIIQPQLLYHYPYSSKYTFFTKVFIHSCTYDK